MSKLFVKFAKLFSITLYIFIFQSLIAFGQTEKAVETEKEKFLYVQPRTIKDFVIRLNELGKLGYKLKLVERNTAFSPPEKHYAIEIAGIVELQEGDTFEYESFQSLTLSDFTEQFSPKAELGFYFCKRISYSIWKDPSEDLPEVTAKPGTVERDTQSLKRSVELTRRLLSQEPIDGSLFIFERKNGIIKPIRFKFATAIPMVSIWGTSILDEKKNINTVQSSLSEIDTVNYSPVATFYSSAAFKTRVSHLPTVLFQNDLHDYYDERPVYKVAETHQFASKLRKQIDLTTQDGYAIKILLKNFALLAKAEKKVTYQWIELNKKDFHQRITEIAKNGGGYFRNETLYTTERLIFETLLNDDGKRFEYKILDLTEKPKFGLSKNPIEGFNEIIKQGFKPCSLFYNDGIKVLLERQILSK